MHWKQPPTIKILEALGAIGDSRVRLTADGAVVTSSSGNKQYTVTYDEDRAAISSNDNGSYFKGYLGYPAIATLMLRHRLPFDPELADALVGIEWKQLAATAGYSYDEIERFANEQVRARNVDLLPRLSAFIDAVERLIDAQPLLREEAGSPPSGW